MRITINIVRRDAAALTGVVRELNAVKTAAKAAGGQVMNWGTRFDTVTKFGKNLQWTGRQLEYRFTLPLVLAGAAATKFALENERALTQLRKVYGDFSMSQELVDTEIKQLQRGFEALSGIFGVHQSEVIEIAAAWAAAGASGIGLARQTRATLEAMIIGDMEAAEATEALITITDSYRLSSEDLTKALAALNIIENETAIRFSGLVEVVQLAGGAARTAGVDIRHLGALAAALVPSAASASEAGNMLKTTISSIMAPTGAAREAIEALGVDMDSLSWTTLNFNDRLQVLAKGYANLDQNQKLQFARNVVNIRQISRLAVLLDDLTAANSRYNKALEVSNDEERNRIRMQKELGDVLASDPRAFQRMIESIKNSLARAIVPLIPAILSVLNGIRSLAQGFADLSPRTQKIVVWLAAMLALLGPIVAYMGSFAILFGTLARWVYDAGRAFAFIVTNPIALFIAAVVAAGIAIYIFRDEISDGLESTIRAFHSFGQGVINLLGALWRGIMTIAQKIYEALSYLNPFARHSPSLVDSVRAGIATILDEYDSLRGIGSTLRAVTAEMEEFRRATDNISVAGSTAARAQDRQDLIDLGATQEAIDLFDRLTDRLAELRAQLRPLQAEIDAQAIVVARWVDELQRAEDALEAAQDRLDELQDIARAARDELDAAKAVLDNLFDYNIAGEQAASDAIFENQMAIKALRLELLRLEESGQSVDDVTDRLAALSGEIEKMQAMEKDLRLAGAGSEITGPLRAQIASLEAQRRSLMGGGAGAGGRAAEIEKQIELLERQGEILELEASIKFDPLRRQLDLLKNGIKEMPFDELVAAIKTQQTEVARLTSIYEDANAAVEVQRKLVDTLSDRRKEVARVFDLENRKLSDLKDAYDAVARAISEVDDAVRSLTQSAGAGGGNALGAPGDFEVPGGTGGIGREVGDINALVDEWIEEMNRRFGEFNPLAGLKAKFEQFMDFLRGWRDRFASWWGEVVGVARSIGETGIGQAFMGAAGWAANAWDSIVDKTGEFWGRFNESIKPLKEELAKWGELWTPFKEATARLWDAIAPSLKFVLDNIRITLGLALVIVREGWDVIWAFTKLFWDNIVGTVRAFLEVLRGAIHVVLGLIRGDWSEVWEGIKTIFSGALHFIQTQWDFFSGLFTQIIPAVLDGLKNVFKSLGWAMKEGAESIYHWIKQAADWIIEQVDRMLGPVDEVLGKLGKVKEIFGSLGGGLDARKIVREKLEQQGVSQDEIERILRSQGLAHGGIVLPRPGGSVFRLGERGYAEAVVPLDAGRGGAVGGGDLHFYGDLVFPNISSGDDADEFVRNLKTLAVKS